jgi:hypothetical protein
MAGTAPTDSHLTKARDAGPVHCGGWLSGLLALPSIVNPRGNEDRAGPDREAADHSWQQHNEEPTQRRRQPKRRTYRCEHDEQDKQPFGPVSDVVHGRIT